MSGPRRTRGLRALAVACAAAGALAACRGGETDRLVVGSVRLPALALVFIAEERGCFADERLVVEHRAFATGRDALDAMRRGEVEVATAFQTPFVLAAFDDPSLRVLTTLHSANRNTHLAARGSIAGSARWATSAASGSGSRGGRTPSSSCGRSSASRGSTWRR